MLIKVDVFDDDEGPRSLTTTHPEWVCADEIDHLAPGNLQGFGGPARHDQTATHMKYHCGGSCIYLMVAEDITMLAHRVNMTIQLGTPGVDVDVHVEPSITGKTGKWRQPPPECGTEIPEEED